MKFLRTIAFAVLAVTFAACHDSTEPQSFKRQFDAEGCKLSPEDCQHLRTVIDQLMNYYSSQASSGDASWCQNAGQIADALFNDPDRSFYYSGEDRSHTTRFVDGNGNVTGYGNTYLGTAGLNGYLYGGLAYVVAHEMLHREGLGWNNIEEVTNDYPEHGWVANQASHCSWYGI